MRARFLLSEGFLESRQPYGEGSLHRANIKLTFAHRKYDSGAVGSFTHLVALQGHNYSCEFEVYADGYSLKYASRI